MDPGVLAFGAGEVVGVGFGERVEVGHGEVAVAGPHEAGGTGIGELVDAGGQVGFTSGGAASSWAWSGSLPTERRVAARQEAEPSSVLSHVKPPEPVVEPLCPWVNYRTNFVVSLKPSTG
jgi:hypothetical protein